MGTMNGMQRQSLSDGAIARLVDPRTGKHLVPIGVVGGRAIWPMMGASPDDPSDGGNDDGGTDDKDKGSEGDESRSKDSGGDGGSDDSKSKGNPAAKIEDLELEKERHFRRRKEAEEEAKEWKKKFEELNGKDVPEVEKLTTRVSELETSNEALLESLRDSRLEVAFLQDNTFEWHNPGRALHLADLSDVEIDDDGKVLNLSKALEKLAKSDPYLIKEKKDTPPNTDKDDNPSKREKGKDSEEKRKSALLEKYPNLRR